MYFINIDTQKKNWEKCWYIKYIDVLKDLYAIIKQNLFKT